MSHGINVLTGRDTRKFVLNAHEADLRRAHRKEAAVCKPERASTGKETQSESWTETPWLQNCDNMNC